MKSALPKVLHPLLGRPMLSYPVQARSDDRRAARGVRARSRPDRWQAELARRFDARVVTTVNPSSAVPASLALRRAGRGRPQGFVSDFYGDAPLIQPRGRCIACSRSRTGSATPLALLTASLRRRHRLRPHLARPSTRACVASAQQKDCSADEAAIPRMEPGVYAIDADFFRAAVAKLTTANKQGSCCYRSRGDGRASKAASRSDVGRERAVRRKTAPSSGARTRHARAAVARGWARAA